MAWYCGTKRFGAHKRTASMICIWGAVNTLEMQITGAVCLNAVQESARMHLSNTALWCEPVLSQFPTV